MILRNFLQSLIPWVISHGIRIVAILFVAWILGRISKVFVSKLINALVQKGGGLIGSGQIQAERAKTLAKVFNSSLKIMIWVIAILTILPELGVNVTPLLAGAGLIGLAIGMGSKNLVQDYLSGLFILLKDQYRVVEEVDLSGTKGEVIELTLRKTILKDSEEVVHYIPNGQIKKVSNLSREK